MGAQADDAEDPEGVAEQGVPQVEGALQVVDARPLLDRDERGRDELREEPVEDEQVRDAREGIAE